MKSLRTFLLCMGAVCSLLIFQSCLDDDEFSLGKYMMAMVSVKAPQGSAVYFRDDDGTTFWPAAGYFDESKLHDGQRVWLNMTLLGDSTKGVEGFDYWIKVNRIDTVLTKGVVKDLGEQNDDVYGKDPVKLYGLWTGNGHLTVRFSAPFGNRTKHLVNLVKKDDPENPYLLEFRHNAFDDPEIYEQEGWVCFDLSTLPEAPAEKVELTIRFYTPDKVREEKISYDPQDR